MKQLLNLYRPAYVKSLAYMLQAVEYSFKDYLNWYWRTPNFGEFVNQNSKFKFTLKSRLVLALAWIGVIKLLAIGLWQIGQWLSGESIAALFLGTGIIMLVPMLTAHLLLIPLWLITWLVQRPAEALAVRTAKKIFAEHHGTTIVIAGSYGKTSLKHYLASVLGTKLKVKFTPGNHNTPVGISKFAAGLEGDEDVLIVEAGEYKPGDIWQIAELTQPDIGLITGVNEQHLLRMKSIDNTLNTIFELADWLDNKNLYVNTESAYIDRRLQKPHITYSREGVGSWRVDSAKTDLKGSSFRLKRGSETMELKTKLLGLHQIGPVAAAAAIASELGLSRMDITKGVAAIEAFDRRFKPRQLSNGATVIEDNYNGNPDGFLVAIEFLNQLQGVKKRAYVTPGIIELGQAAETVHKAIGRELAKSKIDKIYLVANRVTRWMGEGMVEAGRDDAYWVREPDEIYNHLGKYAKKGDIIFLQNSPREAFFYQQ
ncbi:MAG TPA: Mur ligase family protein [Candidatus Saccharimonadales bacterium]